MLLQSSSARGLVFNDGKEGWLAEQISLDPPAEVELILTLLQKSLLLSFGFDGE